MPGPTRIIGDGERTAKPASAGSWLLCWRRQDAADLLGLNLTVAGIENNASIRTLMLNVFYDWDFGTWCTPHIGFGVGYGRNHSDAELNNFATGTIEAVHPTTGNLAWSLMAGMQFHATDNWFADAGYRFIDSGELKAGPFSTGVRLEADDIMRHDLMT